MDKSLIQKRTKEVLEKVDHPREFTKILREILKSFVDEEATKNYLRVIPDTGKFYGVPKPVLGVMASGIIKDGMKKLSKETQTKILNKLLPVEFINGTTGSFIIVRICLYHLNMEVKNYA